MTEPTLIVVHGCERMHRDAIDQAIRSHLGSEELPVISFPDIVAEQNDAVVIEVNASFYPNVNTEASYQTIGNLITKLTKCPTLVMVTNRHPTERHQQIVATLDQQRRTGQLRS